MSHRGDSGQKNTWLMTKSAGTPAYKKANHKHKHPINSTPRQFQIRIITYRTQHQPPIQPGDIPRTRVSHFQKDQVRNETKHDPERGPHLPHHDERAADGRGCAFGGVDGDGGGFGTDAEAEDEAGDLRSWISEVEKKPEKTQGLTKRCGHEFVTPCQMQVRKEKRAVMKMVPRRPKKRLSGSVSQQLSTAQQSYRGIRSADFPFLSGVYANSELT
jgi:hypothetical protein